MYLLVIGMFIYLKTWRVINNPRYILRSKWLTAVLKRWIVIWDDAGFLEESIRSYFCLSLSDEFSPAPCRRSVGENTRRFPKSFWPAWKFQTYEQVKEFQLYTHSTDQTWRTRGWLPSRLNRSDLEKMTHIFGVCRNRNMIMIRKLLICNDILKGFIPLNTTASSH